ncbi:MAG: gfo/Idh/MocA family oxidoreductase, partial [Rhodospirillales bacterium]
FDLFETSLTFEKGQIILEQGTSVVRMRPIEENPRFKGHQTLLGGTNQDGDLGQALYRAVDNFYRAITEGAPLASDGRSALEAQNVCEQLMTMALNT